MNTPTPPVGGYPTDLENALGFLITGTSYLLRRLLLNRLREQGHDYGLSIAELPVLARVFEQPGIGQAELNRLTLRDKTTVTRILAAMEKKGLVCRRADPQDLRARQVYPGEQGKLLFVHLMPAVMAIREELVAAIPPDDLEVTLRTMRRLYGLVSAMME